MATNLATLVLKFVGDTSGINKAFTQTGAGAVAFGNLISSTVIKGLDTGIDLGKSLASAMWEAGKAVAVMGSEMERAQTAFETLVGSTPIGKKLFGDIQQLATETPFGAGELVKEGKLLLGYGVPAQELVGTMRQLGDVASGTGSDIHLLALAYGQVIAKGKLTGEEMNRQLGNAGIGAETLAQGLGVSTAKFQQMVTDGEISAEVFKKIFAKLTQEGGPFYQAPARDLQTVGGSWGQLVETVQLAVGKIGLAIFERFPVAKLLGSLTGSLSGLNIDSLLNGLERVGQAIMPAIEAIASVGLGIFNAAEQFAGNLLPTIQSGSDAIAGFLKSMVKPLLSIVQDVAVAVGYIGYGLTKAFKGIAYPLALMMQGMGYMTGDERRGFMSAIDSAADTMFNFAEAAGKVDLTKAFNEGSESADVFMGKLTGKGGASPVTKSQEAAMKALQDMEEQNQRFMQGAELALPGFKTTMDGLTKGQGPDAGLGAMGTFFKQAEAIQIARGRAEQFGGNDALNRALLGAFKGVAGELKNTMQEPIARAYDRGSAEAQSIVTSAIAAMSGPRAEDLTRQIWERMLAQIEEQKQIESDQLDELRRLSAEKFGGVGMGGGR